MFEPPEQSICYGNPIGPSGSIACADKPYMQAMLSFHYVWINLGHAVNCLMHLGLHYLQTPKTLRSSWVEHFQAMSIMDTPSSYECKFDNHYKYKWTPEKLQSSWLQHFQAMSISFLCMTPSQFLCLNKSTNKTAHWEACCACDLDSIQHKLNTDWTLIGWGLRFKNLEHIVTTNSSIEPTLNIFFVFVRHDCLN